MGTESTKNPDLWDEIGLHRPLGGFWYKLVFEILIIIIPLFTSTYFLSVLYPFPESKGYGNTITGLFVLVFTIFDIGTNNTINRYIADENIRNPAKMVKYIQYFIWYQAMTGLVQVTTISIWAMYFAPNTELAYAIWIMLVVVVKQYPGFPGVFKGVLNSLQQFNKTANLEFIQTEAVQMFTEIFFVLLGKCYGATHPEIGEILGIAIGSVFGLYLDDFIVSIFAAYYLSKSTAQYGITFKRLFMVEFDWSLVKECFTFGLKTSLPNIVSATISVSSLLLVTQYVPQYTTFAALSSVASSIASNIEHLTNQDFAPLFIESYQNGKKKLCEYYHAHALRFYSLNTGFTVAITLSVYSMLDSLFLGFGMSRYLLAIAFIIPHIIVRSTRNLFGYASSLLIAIDKPTQLMLLNFLEQGLKFLSWYLTILVFRVQDLGLAGIVYIIVLTEWPAMVLKSIITFILVNKVGFKLRIMTWQTLVVPPLTTAILYGFVQLFYYTIMIPLLEWNFIGGIVIALLFIIILSLGFYFPLTVWLGGWDENSIRDFKKIKIMSGPSKFLIIPMANMIVKSSIRAPLHNRFKLDATDALKEIEELVLLRAEGRLKMKKSS